MKHFYTLTLGALAMILAFAACKKEEAPAGGDEPAMVTASWTASFEDYQSATKAALQDDLSVEWEDGDAISVFSNRTNYQITASSAEGATATFSGEVAQAETYLALYPYNSEASSSGDNITAVLPETQTLVAGGADPAAMLAVARTQSSEMTFKNMVALVGIKCTGDVESLAITASGEDDRLAGRVRFNTGTGRATAISGSNRIDLDGNPEDGQTYYFAVIPGEVTGLTVVAMNDEGKTAEISVEEKAVTYESNTVTVYDIDFVNDADWILRPPTGQSYVLEGADAVNEFCELLPNPKEEVVDLTIKGSDVTDEIISKIQLRVGAISGNVVWDNVGATTTAGFFDVIDCQGGITISNCQALENAAGFAAYETVGGDLVIEDCPALGQGFGALATVEGSLALRNTSVRIGEGASFTALATVGGDLTVEDNTDITSFAGAALTSVGGSINITGNTALTSLAGLDKLTRVGGDVIITDNGDIPTLSDETGVGYCIIREYLNMSIVSSTASVRLGSSSAPLDLSTLPSCDGTLPGEAQSYTITSQAQLETFLNAGITDETVNNLTITGSDITAETINRLSERVYAVEGTLLLENLTWATDPNTESFSTEKFLSAMVHNYVFDGSIVFRNVTGSINPNGFQVIHEIKGDLIFENCPKLLFNNWHGFESIEKIGGDFQLIASGDFFDGNQFKSLKEVGGDFIVKDLADGQLYFFNGMELETIGGDLVLSNIPNLWGMNGFETLTYIGGDVTVTDYGKMPIKSGIVDGSDCVGLCAIRDLQDNGSLCADAVITISNDGVLVDYSTILSCSATYEGDKSGDGEKFDDPDTVGGWN